VLLAWGTEDPLFRRRELRRFEGLFADPRTVELRGVGHYVPEEAGPRLVRPVREFLADVE
jgi:pimeloyl-ACP methyl ester carboxylesterase